VRNLFIVLAKVVGLLQIPTALQYLNYLILFFCQAVYNENQWYEFGKSSIFITGNILGIGLAVGLAWALLFHTNWIADRLALPEGESNWPKPDSLLYMGIKLLGLFVLVGAIPVFINVTVNPKVIDSENFFPHFWNRIFPSILKLAFGLLLVFKTTKIIELISRDSKPKEIASV
jgi:hypothetical protein